jgi:hypothetical protein
MNCVLWLYCVVYYWALLFAVTLNCNMRRHGGCDACEYRSHGLNAVRSCGTAVHLYLPRRGDLSLRRAASFSFWERDVLWMKTEGDPDQFFLNELSFSVGRVKRNESSHNRCTLCVALWMDRMWRGVRCAGRNRALVQARLHPSAMYTTIHNAVHRLWSGRWERMAFCGMARMVTVTS